ncbi:MAG: hypothetical protein FJ138_03335 [Deltaproteobacteria bacterium]|nr:hypothetical protein [Deltaproteobacteria bacterium]
MAGGAPAGAMAGGEPAGAMAGAMAGGEPAGAMAGATPPALCYGAEPVDLNAALDANGSYEGTLEGLGASRTQGSCGGGNGPELVFAYTTAVPLTRLSFSTEHPETTKPVVMYVREACEDTEDLACDRGVAAAPGKTVSLTNVEAGTYLLFVDTGNAMIGPGPFRLTVTADGAPQCRDTVDNDGDGLVDLNDPGCVGPEDLDEDNPATLPECADRVDNDGDRLVDYPADPDCAAAGADRERALCAADFGDLVEVGQGGGAFAAAIPAAKTMSLAEGCRPSSGPEAVFHLRLTAPSDVRVTASPSTLAFSMYLRASCDDVTSQVSCATDLSGPLVARDLEPGDYFLFVDAHAPGAVAEAPAVEVEVTSLITECNDGVDNDNDGDRDLDDVGCEQPRDLSEADPAVAPACADGLDNDGDGLIDYPVDADCSARGSRFETAGCDNISPAAVVGMQGGAVTLSTVGEPDNYRGTCAISNSVSGEQMVALELSDPAAVRVSVVSASPSGFDSILYLRPSCEAPEPRAFCDDTGASNEVLEFARLERGRYFLFLDGWDSGDEGTADLLFEVSPLPLAACEDGADNDGDGDVDAQDVGCATPFDADEADPAVIPACADGVDNDADTLTDYPADPGCFTAGFETEAPLCPAPLLVAALGAQGGSFAVSHADGGNFLTGSCAPGEGVESVARLTLSELSDVRVEVVDAAGAPVTNAIAYIRATCAGADLACGINGVTRATLLPAGEHFVVVERRAGQPLPAAPWEARVTVTSRIGECNDGVDNDGNAFVDLNDPGCEQPFDQSERAPADVPECFDGVDNDSDGVSDYPGDPDCVAAGDDVEARRCEGVDAVEVGMQGVADFLFDPAGRPDVLEARCSFGTYAEAVFAITLTELSNVRVTVRELDGSPAYTYRNLRTSCNDDATEVSCDDLSGASVYPALAAGTYFIVVERDDFDEDLPFTVSVDVESLIGECNDAVDNDGDARVDLNDPGCAQPFDRSEVDPAVAPQCADGADNDGDGEVDYPADPDCAAAGDDVEETRCADNDAVEVGPEGLRDYIFDPAGRPDNLEASCSFGTGGEAVFALTVPELSDVLVRVNNLDGTTTTAFTSLRLACDDERTERACSSSFAPYPRAFRNLAAGVYYLIVERSSNASPLPFSVTVEQVSLITECNDGVDNDEDGARDNADIGCESSTDDDETDPAAPPACANTLDDDGNGVADYPADRSCFFAGQRTEGPFCLSYAGALQVVTASGVVSVNTTGLTNRYTSDCGGSANSNEVPIAVVLSAPSTVRVETNSAALDTVLHARASLCDVADRQIGCNDDNAAAIGDGNDSLLTFERLEPGVYYVFADGYSSTNNGAMEVTFTITPIVVPTTQCNDGVDNDGDGRVDLADAGCATGGGASEVDPAAPPACADGADNDGDALTDYPADPDCYSAGDAQEAARCAEAPSVDLAVSYSATASATVSPEPAAAEPTLNGSCGGVVYGDAGVVALEVPELSDLFFTLTAADGTSAARVLSVRAACDDARSELACERATSFASERAFRLVPAGRYYVIVERTSLSDRAPLTLSVRAVSRVTECNDGVDNDGDGLVDLLDYGCVTGDSRAELFDETRPVPECGDGVDNDADARIDYPADDDCTGAGDGAERTLCLSYDAVSVTSAGGSYEFSPAAGVAVADADLASCAFSGGDVAAFALDIPELSNVSVSVTNADGSAASAYRVLRAACDDVESELSCASNFSSNPTTFRSLAAGTYFLLVHRSEFATVAPFTVDITVQSLIVQCNDRVDNDGDGLVDSADPGCEESLDPSEGTDAEPGFVTPQCYNALDDDSSGAADYPADPLCLTAGQAVEGPFCAEFDGPITVVTASRVVQVNTAGLANNYTSSCGGSANSNEVPIAVVLSARSNVRIETTSGIDTVLHVRAGLCDDVGGQLACNDDSADSIGDGNDSLITLTGLAPGVYYVFADGFSSFNNGAMDVIFTITPN